MDKWSKRLYITTLVLIFLPVVLRQFIDFESTFLGDIPWGFLFIISGGTATLLAIFTVFNDKEAPLTTLFLFKGLGLGIIGLGLKTIGYAYDNHIILAGILFFLLWLLLPNRNVKED